MEQGYCQQMKQDVEVAITTGTVEESPLWSSLLHARPSYVGMAKLRQGAPSQLPLLTDTWNASYVVPSLVFQLVENCEVKVMCSRSPKTWSLLTPTLLEQCP